MLDTIIKVNNLGKCYQIGHENERGYTALRDVISQKAKGAIKSIFHKAEHQSYTKEDFWALKDVDFEIRRGEAVGIIGRNGAGKSTLLKLLSRITEPTTGSIILNGRVASLLEVGTGFHPELSGRENIFLNGAIMGMTRKEIRNKFDEIVDFSGVEKFLDTPVKRYSSGMYVRLAFAVAAHLEPEILIVDEILAVGDSEFQKKCLGKMNDVSQNGRTVLFVSHNTAAIDNLCKTVILLKDGTVDAIGPSSEIIQRYLQDPFSRFAGQDHPADQIFKRSNKQAQVTRLEFLSNGQHAEILYMGSDLHIRMHYTTQVILESPMMGVILYDAMGAPLLFFNNKNYGVYFGKKTGQDGVISIKFDNLNLTPGFYSFDIYFSDQLVDLDVKSKCFTFQVVYKHMADGGEPLNEKVNRIFYKDVFWDIS